jgi:hypothetical protein
MPLGADRALGVSPMLGPPPPAPDGACRPIPPLPHRGARYRNPAARHTLETRNMGQDDPR